ncbi:GNAT family N-acetyltransferase [Cellulomonas gilvus]|uniref:GCN5-related N-acetyltransferase n=1 Tax=Cellulomonas gilvus (strain ATCC 13127 / NRRL B-14078) TaxID=593907 RepID=F8A2X9_CELGA|nr:GNAT family N-acetyltransferase [Cellulomonas gilvus]AEI10696.1 GCN5-related N-acetyltransferase [Cellulomonas gilvus ATCC 13127]
MVDVVEVTQEERFEARRDGELLGFAAYTLDRGTVVLTHTEVFPEHEGQGVAGELVRGALDQVRASGRDVVPLCPYVRAWLGRHPEYQDLVRADPSNG